MYCLKNCKQCEYSTNDLENISCEYENATNRTYDKCDYATVDFARIIRETFSDKDYEEFGKEMLLWQNNKYINERLESILFTCYENREIESAMEHIEKIFYKMYALKKIKEQKNREN